MSRPEARPLLPQTAPMQNYSFAPPNMGVGDTKKNYVFVDEHNRHKRLKVMRACEGCRRRKIKCDAATTNSWPCGACVRLKLQCIPPTVNYNRQLGSSQVSGHERVLDFGDQSDNSGDEGNFIAQPLMRNVYTMPSNADMMAQSGFAMGFNPKHDLQYDSLTSAPMTGAEATYTHGSFSNHISTSPGMPIVERSQSWPNSEAAAGNLSDVLGRLKIEETGQAAYIKQKNLAEAPAMEENEFQLPPGITGPGSSVRIPPELMPNDEDALHYLDVFFTQIHPYVPVISKSYFYQQWNNNRDSISPLLLEAIFACAGRISDDPAQGAQWLALAGKHENCFMDVPRLSTLQALLLLLKAREANPKRGYYYRSWMAVKTACSMAKDLELHEHHALHQTGQQCPFDETECLIKTRIWQNIFVCEIMVGGPQGRHDFGTDIQTVDFNVRQCPPGGDEEEYRISRNYVYFVRAIRNVRMMSDAYQKIKADKAWAGKAQFTQVNQTITKWLEELPTDMQIHMPEDGSLPWVPSHFVGNVHCYYYLSVLILRRPQLTNAENFSAAGSGKEHLRVCIDAAKNLCKIQEAVFQQYEVNGILCMQRGINFAIYCILTCTMIHLAAITSPDPEFNNDAAEYFTRSMRLLEKSINAWPASELQQQVQSLRDAFSADTTKAFELKPSFPYGSPVTRVASSPLSESQFTDAGTLGPSAHDQSHLTFVSGGPMTPPVSAHDDCGDGNMGASLAMMQNGQRPSIGDDGMATWNPKRLFEQWNTAFGTPQSSGSGMPQHPQSPTAMYSPTASTVGSSHDFANQVNGDPNSALAGNPGQFQLSVTSMGTAVPSTTPTSFAAPPTSHQFVSPSMWQETVASTYVPNDLKRRWDSISGPAWSGTGSDGRLKVKRHSTTSFTSNM